MLRSKGWTHRSLERCQRYRSKVEVKGQGQRSGSKVEVKGRVKGRGQWSGSKLGVKGLDLDVKGQGQRSRSKVGSKVEVKGQGQRPGQRSRSKVAIGVKVVCISRWPCSIVECKAFHMRQGTPRNPGFYPQPTSYCTHIIMQPYIYCDVPGSPWACLSKKRPGSNVRFVSFLKLL